MKKILFLFLVLSFTASRAYPMSLKFTYHPFYTVWADEITLGLDNWTIVYVWVDEVEQDLMQVHYEFSYDPKMIAVDLVQVSDSLAWDSDYTIIYKIKDGLYSLDLMNLSGVSPPYDPPYDKRILLHTFLLRCIGGGESIIEASNPIIFDMIFNEHNPDNAQATIIGPCKVFIDPETSEVKGKETIQFSADSKGSCNNPRYSWEVTSDCGSTIDGGNTLSSNGSYTAGDVGDYCTDTIKVTDTANGNIFAEAVVDITPTILIEPRDEIIGSGNKYVFTGTNNGFCESDPIYSWDIESLIGSTIGAGNTINANGSYTAGKEFTGCEDAEDIIKLTATCDEIEKTVEVPVKIPACTATITPGSATIKPEETIELGATPSLCCKNPPVYSWSVNGVATTDNTSNTYTYKAGSEEKMDIIKVVDTANNNSADFARVVVKKQTTTTTVIPTTTTTIRRTTTTSISDIKTCITNKDCDDGDFCNGVETCVYSWSVSLQGTTGNTGNKLGICESGEALCQDDGMFCNGEESCDEEDEICLHSGDPCDSCVGDMCDEENDMCTECLEDGDCDDGLFCNGKESCEDGICQQGESPCNADERCNEEKDICEPLMEQVDITLIPGKALRLYFCPIPLFMYIKCEDTSFDSTTQVKIDEFMIPNPFTLVLSEDLLFTFTIIQPSSFPATDITVEVTVTTGNKVGKADLLLKTPLSIFKK